MNYEDVDEGQISSVLHVFLVNLQRVECVHSVTACRHICLDSKTKQKRPFTVPCRCVHAGA